MRIDRNVYMWAVIENIAIYIIVAVLFILTKTAWPFLLLLLINHIKREK